MTSASTEGRRVITAAEITQLVITATGAAPELFDGPHQESSLVELGLDSLALLEIQVVAKERLALEIPDHGLELTVSELTALANTGQEG
ncbi:acyl carrier protein [Kitasatospora viridis]|uniref:Acyl carrier protein n=1 Tax=Kitasatospora viridis TaxID=281105 RepID=A0A561UCI8_9ACTN|nr:acyl carrier protein [Kitasatospora viridis]TWF97059.1 acyl carrier protein [Kitasatospora viridis]